ncbi:hypothetical protein [uncultured Tessaracoccus sp.]|uniref:hypothetical protein n=1 Tax=uncultured Tessaracoccus sp. TaxID=905023 RepID=UPI00262E7E53|nr:hypothetical protein [uncultured Tessaracoccus sp.]
MSVNILNNFRQTFNNFVERNGFDAHPGLDGFWLTSETLDRIQELMPTVNEMEMRKTVTESGIARFARPVHINGYEAWGTSWYNPERGQKAHLLINRREGTFTTQADAFRVEDDSIVSFNGEPGVADAARFIAAMHKVLREEAERKRMPGSRGKKSAKKGKGNKVKGRGWFVSLSRPVPKPTPERSEPTGRHITCRYVVREHTRQQAYGPGRSLRRTITVPAHVRGPEDAPLKHRNYRVAVTA